jgi:hypothetical protein
MVTNKSTWGHACAACNLHTAIALVSKMKALGIKASCSRLIMRPEVALQKRQRIQGQQQARSHCTLWPRPGCSLSTLCHTPLLREIPVLQQTLAALHGT